MLTLDELKAAYHDAIEKGYTPGGCLLVVKDAVLADAEKDFKVRVREAERDAYANGWQGATLPQSEYEAPKYRRLLDERYPVDPPNPDKGNK